MNIINKNFSGSSHNLVHTKTKKNDLILLVVLLLICTALSAGYYFTHRTPALRAEVSVDGKVVQVLDLSKDQEITIEDAHHGTNHLVVKDGEIWCSNSSCADKICVYQGKQSMDGDSITCLPNLMFVWVIGDK